MFKVIETNNLDNYFVNMKLRSEKGVYFYRLIGYDNEDFFYEFERKMYIESIKNGIHFGDSMKNPNEEQIFSFYDTTGFKNFNLDDEVKILNDITAWLPQLDIHMRKVLLETLIFCLKEVKLYKKETDGIIKNIYIKIMCWIKNYFLYQIQNINNGIVPKIMYNFEISKHEIYCLRIMSLIGFDIVYINYISDDSYMKVDTNNLYSSPIYGKIRKIPDKKYTDINANNYIELEKLNMNLSNNKTKVITNQWCKDDLFTELNRSKKDRNARCNVAGPNDITNLYFLYLGYDDLEQYSNRLYYLRKHYEDRNFLFILIENKLDNPTIDEINFFLKVKSDNLESLILNIFKVLDFVKNQELNLLVKKTFKNIVEKNTGETFGKINNTIIKLLCWFRRYYDKLNSMKEIPLFVFYGVTGKYESMFMEIISEIGFDVIYISCDVNLVPILSENSKVNTIKLENTMDLIEFPKTELKVRVSTVAKQASEELNEMIYNKDVGVFRYKQYTNSKTVTLRTTYEEIKVLWRHESKFRTGFEVKNDSVYIPNIFAKIKGTNTTNPNKYWDNVRNFITDNTLIVDKLPFTKDMDRQKKFKLTSCFHENTLDIEKILSHSEYKFGFIDDSVQHMMMDKIQELINLKMIINIDNPQIEIISSVLSMDIDIIRTIQDFDFTKEIPKILIADVYENMMTLSDCIVLSFCNLIGFDIVIFTPTGYKNIEKFVNPIFYDSFVIGKYNYDMSVPILVQKDKDSIIKKLFRF